MGSGDQQQQPSVAKARQLLYRRLKVLLKSGRVIEGDFACLDKQGNLILSNASEHIVSSSSSSSSSTGGGSAAGGSGGISGSSSSSSSSPAQAQLGMVLVPKAQQADVLLQLNQHNKHKQHRTFRMLKALGDSLKKAAGDNKPVPKPDLALLASGAVVFGVQRLVPTYDHSWYRAIIKPDWTPPNWVFPAVWIPLKLLQSVSLWLVLKQADTRKQLLLPVTLFGLHLFLGNWWNVVFFGRRQMDESVKWMGAFWASIAASIASFYQVSPLAAALFAPTQVWVTIAAKLNYDIVSLNKGNKEKST